MDNDGKITVFSVGCILLLFCALVFVVFFGWPIKTVQPGQVMLIQRFGKLEKDVKRDGLHIEFAAKGIKYNTREQALNTQETAATKDLQDIKVDITLNYKFDGSKAVETYKKYGDADNVIESIIKPRISSRLKAETANYTAEQLIQKRGEVTDKARKNLTEELINYNVIVTSVEIKNIDFTSKDFNDAIERKQVAEQRSLQAKFELETAKTEAEKARIQSQTLSPQYLQKLYIEKWNGQLPQYMGEGANIMITPEKKK